MPDYTIFLCGHKIYFDYFVTKFIYSHFTCTCISKGGNQLLIEKGQILGYKLDVTYTCIWTSSSSIILFVAEWHGIHVCSKIISVLFLLGSFNGTLQM